MKKTRIIALLLTTLLLIGLFAGCSKSTGSAPNMGDSALNQEIKPEGIYDNLGNETPQVTDRKLIRTVTMDAETEDMDPLLSAVDAKVKELGGYVEDRSVYTGSSYASYQQTRRAELVLRIPAENLDAFVSHVAQESNIISSSESAEDVTLSYVAVESRMKALQQEEERLMELIGKAANLSELLQLESRLTEVRTQLEQVTSQLRLYDNLVDYGTVKLTVREVQTLTPVEEPGFWERISSGLLESLNNLWNFLQELVIFLVTTLPYFLPIAAIVLAIISLIRFNIRRKRKKAQSKPETQE